MYLVVVKNLPEGFDTIKPYIMTIPEFTGSVESGSWVYNINATPKVSVGAKLPPTEVPPVNDKTKTGDLQNPGFYLSILGIAVLGVITLTYVKSRKHSA